MPDNLARFLPFLDEATRAELFGSISLATEYPLGDPIRKGVIQGEQELSRSMAVRSFYLSMIHEHSLQRDDESHDSCCNCCRRLASHRRTAPP